MKINYEILWFEDQPDQLEHDLEAIRAYLSKSGFSMEVDMRKTLTNNDVDKIVDKISKYNKYDMIIFDYDLGDSPKGSEIARRLRAEVYTDMIFYSGREPESLRKILFDTKVDGVFIVDRRDLADQIEPILEDHIKKACDVNGIRGIVMDETSRFDRLLREKCKQILADASAEELEQVRKDLVRRIKKSAASRQKNAEKISCPISALSDFQVSDFNLVRHRLAKLMDKVTEVFSLLSEEGELKEMQDLRNRLAHLECSYSEEGWMSLSDNADDRFDFERFREIRKTLRDIGIKLENI